MATVTVGAGQLDATLAGTVVTSSDADILQAHAGTCVCDFSTITAKNGAGPSAGFLGHRTFLRAMQTYLAAPASHSLSVTAQVVRGR